MARTREHSRSRSQPASLEPIMIGIMPVSSPGDSIPLRMGGVFPSRQFMPWARVSSGEKFSDG